MMHAPSGTVTFLFTDIVGSTRLWEQSPVAMADALTRHNALLREAIEANDGYVFKTIGDAFCAAFPTASGAVRAAIAAQRAFAQESWPESTRIRVRMALHTGTAEAHDNDYFGPSLNRVSRLAASGHGGQVLLSHATREMLRDGLPAGVALRDMGARRLKDLIRPERIYQLVAPQLLTDFPPLKTLDAHAHNLPIQTTSFVGRDRDMQDVKTLLRSARLVTLTGSGGAGKTRLSLQIGADCIDEFADGVWLIELAPLTDPRLVPQMVATVLGIKEQRGATIAETLTKKLKTKGLLLLLDNCEHLVDAAANLCQGLLNTCDNVRMLVTSREALRVNGETIYRVPSLATPDPSLTTSFESLGQYSAAQLFIDRALAVQPGFQLDNVNARAVANICHRLDGIPLAIELAAANVRSMSVEEVNDRLHQRFRLLTGGSRTVLPRHRTLLSLIDWSYELLEPSEQALLHRLSVFSGWTLEAAEHVCSDDSLDKAAILDLIRSLAEKSMVIVEDRHGSARYRLLETVREYARAPREEENDGSQWRRQHFAYFLALAEEGSRHLEGADQRRWFDRLAIEHDNIRTALTFANAGGVAVTDTIRLVCAMFWFWYVRGHVVEGRNWIASVLPAVRAGNAATHAYLLGAAGTLAAAQGDYVAAEISLTDALAIRRDRGDRAHIAYLLANLGAIASAQRNYAEARAFHEEAGAIGREIGDSLAIVASLLNLGILAKFGGDSVRAKSQFDQGLTIARQKGLQTQVAIALALLGDVARMLGDVSTALLRYKESMEMSHSLGYRDGLAQSFEGLGSLVSPALLPRARMWGAAERLREQIGVPLSGDEQLDHDVLVSSARIATGDEAAFNSAWQEGHAFTVEQAIEHALERIIHDPDSLIPR